MDIWEPHLAAVLWAAHEDIPRTLNKVRQEVREAPERFPFTDEQFDGWTGTLRGVLKALSSDQTVWRIVTDLRHGVASHHGAAESAAFETHVAWMLASAVMAERSTRPTERRMGELAIELFEAISVCLDGLAPPMDLG